MTQVPDWLAALAILAPVATAMGGYWLAGRNEEARDAREAEREKCARRESFGERRAERSHEFQRQLLLDLQTAIQKEIRATAKVVFQDRQTLTQHGTLNMLPPGLSDEAFDAGVDFSRLVVRVLNDDLRAELESLHEIVASVEAFFVVLIGQPVQQQLDQLDATMKQLTEVYVKVNLVLGEHLRSELAWIPEWADPTLQGK